ncbi:MAG: AmmeMemoRadiSam system protein B [Verrucomicrobia bacterium]|nr:AmmeMemoRadiSam system protein B [Verrucomicrobiota bacterium]
MNIRRAYRAGEWYPADPEELKKTVLAYLSEVKETGPAPKALIAPHAGYVYSGPIAASAYARLRDASETIRKVILLGPAHFVDVRGLAVSSAEAFETPLGSVPIDKELRSIALDFAQVVIDDEAHRQEHSLEAHIPFLQVVLNDFSLLPFAVRGASPEQVSEVLQAVWGGDETLIVVSSDLSHFLEYDVASKLDKATSLAIEECRYEDIGHDQACGREAISGLLKIAREHSMHVRNIDLRNSGDTAGPRNQVVGYGAYVVTAE